jgi:SpoVK/Ycf46/Vps4 family AAA+-type ATPase
MNINCEKCGTENRSLAKYCKKCGTTLKDNLLSSLNNLVGRDEIKTCLNELVRSVGELKKGWNKSAGFNINMILIGGTGTGKTSLATLINSYLFDKDVLSKEKVTMFDASEFDHFIENIEENFKKSKGGILFIDNFDKLLPHKNNYGGVNNIDRLLFEMDKQGNDPVILLAGSKGNFEEYLTAHPAFMNRFEYYFRLKDFNTGELYFICKNKLEVFGLKLNEDSAQKLFSLFKYSVKKKDHTFGNAHYAVNIASDLARSYYLRISRGVIDDKIITVEDIKKDVPEIKSVNRVLAELDELVGLEKVKAAVREIASFIKFQLKKEKENPGNNKRIGMHIVLTGNPGTGKTTIARKLGEVLSAIDYLDRGHVVEVDKSGLVGEYVGETL